MKRAVAYVQEVTIRVPVTMTGREGDFDTINSEDAAEWVMAYVRGLLPARMRDAAITPSRGPGGSRYYFPEEIAEGRGPEGGLRVPVGRITA